MQGGIATMGTTITIDGTPIYGAQDISGPGLSTDVDDVTNHSSPDHTEERIATVKRLGDVSFPCVVDTADAGFQALFAAWQDRSVEPFVMTYPDGSTQTFDGYVTGFGLGASVTGHLSADVTITPKSAPDIEWAAS